MAITRLNNNSITSVTALPSGVGGKVLQVVMGAEDTYTVINSTNYSTLNFDAQITLSSTSSKVFVQFSGGLEQDDYNGAIGEARLLRDISGGTQGTQLKAYGVGLDSSENRQPNSYAFTYLDSPNSTAQLTYRLQGKTENSSGDFRSKGGRIVLMEIGT